MSIDAHLALVTHMEEMFAELREEREEEPVVDIRSPNVADVANSRLLVETQPPQHLPMWLEGDQGMHNLNLALNIIVTSPDNNDAWVLGMTYSDTRWVSIVSGPEVWCKQMYKALRQLMGTPCDDGVITSADLFALTRAIAGHEAAAAIAADPEPEGPLRNLDFETATNRGN